MARSKQTRIPGTEQKKVPEIERAADHYVDVRDKRMELTEAEVDAKDKLLAAMRKHGLDVYHLEDAEPPLVVTVLPGEATVKVRKEVVEPAGNPADEAADGKGAKK